MSVTYTVVLEVSEDSILFLSGLLHAERLPRGTRKGRRALGTYKQAVLVLRWFLEDPAVVTRFVQRGSELSADLVYCRFVRGFLRIEHRYLQRRAMCTKSFHHVSSSRLHDEMKVPWHAASMRPQANVDLLRSHDLLNRGSHAPQQRTKLGTLRFGQLRDMHDMTKRFDHQRPDAQRPHAVLDHP